MTTKLIENSGLTDKEIKVVCINTFLGNIKLLGLGRKIRASYKFSSAVDELIVNTSELDRIVKFGCALEVFVEKFMIGESEAWETLETFLEDPEKHLKPLFDAGTSSFKSLVKAAIKNKENYLNHYWVTKKEIIEGFYNVVEDFADELKEAKKSFKVFDEPEYVYEWE